MSETIFTGTMLNYEGENEEARVVAVDAGQTFIDETEVGADGSWSLKTSAHVDWIVAQTRGARIAAVAARPQEMMQLSFPETVELELEFEGVDGFAALWLDPLELQGFPDELLWALRAHLGDIKDLHIAELQIRTPVMKLEVQPGRYRISGGRFSISDEIINTNLRLARALERDTGTSIESINGAVVVAIFQPANYLLNFSQA